MNKKFNILKGIGIILVVAVHSGINFLNWFPILSFVMPLFMFISGYFFKPRNIKNLLSKKLKHLIVPFLLWNLFYGIIAELLTNYGLINFSQGISTNTLLIEPFITNHQFMFNVATWFVGTLFIVQCLYCIMNNIVRSNLTILSILSIIFYVLSLKIAFYDKFLDFTNIELIGNYSLVISRALYMFIFYHLGYIYRIYIEKIDKFSIYKMIICTLVNGIFIGFFNINIANEIVVMKIFTHNELIPLISSITGICFYLQVAELLKDKIKDNSILMYIGKNTFSIMTHHIMFFWLLNTFFLYLKINHILTLNTFIYDEYMNNIFFRISAYSPVNDLIYFIVALSGSICFCYIWENVIKIIKKYLFNFRLNY